MLTFEPVVVAGSRTLEAPFGTTPAAHGGNSVAAIGANGARKTTPMRTKSTIIRPPSCAIKLQREDVLAAAPDRGELSIALAPENRLVSRLTVEGNLRRELAGSTSGGERQMYAIDQALTSDLKRLLAAVVVEAFETCGRLRSSRLAVLSVKQHLQRVLRARDRAHPLAARHFRASGSRAAVLATDGYNQAYLGV